MCDFRLYNIVLHITYASMRLDQAEDIILVILIHTSPNIKSWIAEAYKSMFSGIQAYRGFVGIQLRAII